MIKRKMHLRRGPSVKYTAASIALRQMEGGEELRESSTMAGLALHPFIGTAFKGKELYRNKVQKNFLSKRLKRVDSGSRRRNNTSRITNKENIRSLGNRARKELTKAGRKVSGHRAKQLEIRNSIRNRMLHYFINKSKQNDNGDGIGAVIKDMVLMKVSVVVRNLAGYIGGFLLTLMLLVAVVSVPVMLIIVLLYNSPVAIFLPSLEEGDTVKSVTSAYIQDFNREISNLAYGHVGYDGGSITYATTVTDNFYDIMVVYMVKYGIGDTASVMNDTTKSRLKEIFEDMCSYSTSVATYTVEDEDGTTTTFSILCVSITKRSYRDMVSIYGFSTEEAQLLDEMMSPDNLALMQ